MVELMTVTDVFKEHKEVEFYETIDTTRYCWRFRFPKTRRLEQTMQKAIVALDSDYYKELPWEPIDMKIFKRLKKAADKSNPTYKNRLVIGTTVVDTTHYI